MHVTDEIDLTIAKPTRRPTLQDIAKRAGVTIGTASGVLQDKAKERRISDDVAKRVLDIAHSLDYTPNLLVKSLQRGNTNILSFYNGFRARDRRDLYMDGLTNAIERAAGSQGYDTLVFCNFNLSATDTYRSINGGHNDGLIFFRPKDDDPLIPYIRRSSLPVVLLNVIDTEGSLSYVSDDWQQGIRQIVDSIVSLDHRRIAALTNSENIGDSRQRAAYFRDCLAQHDIDLRDDRIIPVEMGDSRSRLGALEYLMSQADPPTVLFCWHDLLGYTVLQDCDTLGIKVPEQLSVIGYDGLRWPARTKHILASVHVDLDFMGEAAVESIVQIITNGGAPIRKLMPVRFDAGTTLSAPQEPIRKNRKLISKS